LGLAKTVVDLESLPAIDRPGRIAILKSKWYPEIVDSLTDTCERVLRARGIVRVDLQPSVTCHRAR